MRGKWVNVSSEWKRAHERRAKRQRRKRPLLGLERTIKVSGSIDPVFERRMLRKGVRVERVTD